MASEDFNLRFTNADSAMVTGQIGEPIFGVSRKDGLTFDPKEGLMDSWDITTAGDKVVMTIVIKPNIPFHYDEGVVTAEDVKYSWLQIIKDGSTNAGSATKKKIIGNDPNAIQVVDARTLKFNIDRANAQPEMQTELSNYGGGFYGVVPKAYMERVGEEGFRKRPISTGPFRFVDHIQDQRVTLEAVPNHWRKTAAYQRINILKVPDPATRLAMLQSGEIAITDIVPGQVAQVERNNDTKVLSFPGGATVTGQLGGMILPTRSQYDPSIPWVGTDPLGVNPTKVRKAMNLAIDRQAIVSAVLKGHGKPMVMWAGFATPGQPWYNPGWQPYPYKPDEARQLMREAGYPNGFEMNAWVFALANGPLNGDIMVAVAGYWQKELNIKVNLQQAEYNPTVRQNFLNRSFGNYALTYTAPSVAATSQPYKLTSFCSTCVLAYFELPSLDPMMAQLSTTLDRDQLFKLTRQIGDIFYDNYLQVPTVEVETLWGLNKKYVGDWNKSPYENWAGDLAYVTKPG